MNHPGMIPFWGYFRSRMARRMAGKPFTLSRATELGASMQQHFCCQMCVEMCSNISLRLTDLLGSSILISDQSGSGDQSLVTDQPGSGD
jgi:hypothetical protein